MIPKLLRKLARNINTRFEKSSASRLRKRRRSVTPALELLEERSMLSVYLDPSFGSGGLVQADTGLDQFTAYASGLEPDGKVVVVGSGARVIADPATFGGL